MSAVNVPHLLYVDDEEANRTVFSANFENDFPLLIASSGQEALELCEKYEVALVLTDERMDGMRGTELLERVRERHPDCLRAVVTAYGDLETVLQAVNKGGVWRYLLKPWSAADLRVLLTHALEIYGFAKQRRALQVQLMLAERKAIIGLLAGSVGHELRNALSASLTNVSVLKSMAPPIAKLIRAAAVPDAPAAMRGLVAEHRLLDEADELMPCIEDLEGSLNHITDVTGGLVDAMRPPRAELSEINLSALLESMKRVFMHVVVKSGPRFRAEIDSGVHVLGDAVAIRQILLNLLMNASQATDPARPPGLVVLRCLLDGTDGGRLEVEDSGTGMTNEVLERMFEPLFTTKGQSGTGLGLAISRQLAESQGAKLTVASEPGRGSCFTLRFPPTER